MTIGGSIALIVIGAILSFAVEYDLTGISLDVVGYILMIGGLVGLVFSIVATTRRTRSVRRAPDGHIVEEHVEDREL